MQYIYKSVVFILSLPISHVYAHMRGIKLFNYFLIMSESIEYHVNGLFIVVALFRFRPQGLGKEAMNELRSEAKMLCHANEASTAPSV